LKIFPKKSAFDFWPKLISIALVAGSIGLFFFFLVTCLVYFPTQTVSTKLTDLGLYGDFFGGIVGSIVSMASLGVTIYLAVILHRIEKENTESSIEGQRRIAIMQLKFQELIHFKTECDKAFEILSTRVGQIEDSERAHKTIIASLERLSTIFPELEDLSAGHFGFMTIANEVIQIHKLNKYLYNVMNYIDGIVHIDQIGIVSIDQIIADAKMHFEKGLKEYFDTLGKLSKWAAT
jgi:hypothetical protein